MLTCAHSSIIHNGQDMETISVSTDRWMDKEDMVHRYNGILLSDKKEWNNAICSNMDGSRDCHTKWSKSEKEWHMPHLCVDYNIWHKWTYLENRNRCTDIKNRCVVVKGEGLGEGEIGSLRLAETKYYRGWTNNRVLPYSTGDYVQYSVIDHNGKEYNIKKNAYIYILCI